MPNYTLTFDSDQRNPGWISFYSYYPEKILGMNILQDTGSLQDNVAHRPAKLFRFDEKIYKSLKNSGFVFEV